MAHWTPSNHNHADEYIGSALPFVTSSTAPNVAAPALPHHIVFPYVTRWVMIVNNGSGALRVGFSQNGTISNGPNSGKDHFFRVPASSATERLELKLKEIFVVGDGATPTYQVVAGYTNIPTKNFPTLTGSAGFEGVG